MAKLKPGAKVTDRDKREPFLTWSNAFSKIATFTDMRQNAQKTLKGCSYMKDEARRSSNASYIWSITILLRDMKALGYNYVLTESKPIFPISTKL